MNSRTATHIAILKLRVLTALGNGKITYHQAQQLMQMPSQIEFTMACKKLGIEL